MFEAEQGTQWVHPRRLLSQPAMVAAVCAAMVVWVAGSATRAAGAEWESELGQLPCRILFEAYADENWDLWSVRPDGSDLQNLTETADVHELYPQASPDGKWIAFLVDEPQGRDTRRSLWLMKSDGSERQEVATGSRHACWSPDGKQLAFAKQEFRRFPIKDYASKGVYFYDVATQKTTEHPNTAIHHIYVPTWSADGKWLVATVHAGMGFGHAIVGLENHGNRVIDLHLSGCRPCLSPQGNRVTWSRDDHTICVADVTFGAEGPSVSHERVLYHHDTMHLYHPDFSPDGQFVSFSMGPGGRMPAAGPGTHTEVAEMVGVKGIWDLYVKKVDADGEPFRVTHAPDRSNKESEWMVTADTP